MKGAMVIRDWISEALQFDICLCCCTYHVLREHLPEHLRLLVRSFIVSLHVQLWKRRFALVVVAPK